MREAWGEFGGEGGGGCDCVKFLIVMYWLIFLLNSLFKAVITHKMQ